MATGTKTTIVGKPSPKSVLLGAVPGATIVGRSPKDLPPPAQHSPLGPSSSERWMNCPGSVRLTASIPDPNSGYAEEGTAAHTLSEWCRKRLKPAKAFLGHLVPVLRSDGSVVNIVVDQVMVDGVQAFIDYVNEFESDLEIIEGRVSYEAWVENGWGTLDHGQINEKKKRVILTDLKYGMGVKVYAKENTQLKFYALGIFQDYGHLYDIDEFQLNIFQPRLDHIDEWTISVVDLLKWAEDVVKPAALETTKPNAKFAAGAWCQFCRAKATCDARATWVFEQTKGDFEDLDAAVVPQPGLLGNDAIGRLLDSGVTALIKSWCNDVEEYGMSQLQAGHAVGTQKLVEGRSSRQWRDAEKAEEALRKLRGIKVADIFKTTLISPPAAEKLLGKKHPILVDHVIKPPGKPVMVPGGDPRPTLKVDANKEFEDLGAEPAEEKESWE